MKFSLLTVTLTACLAFSPTVQAVTIDFNSLSSGQSVTNQFQAQGVVFSSRTGTTTQNAAISQFIGFSGVNDPAVTNSIDGGGDRQQFLVLDFLSPVFNLSFDYGNYGDFFSGGNFKAYDSTGTLLETQQPSAASIDALEHIVFSTGNISKLELEQPMGGWIFAVDNVSYDVTAVPEPATWTMLGSAGSVLGLVLIRRKR